MARRLTDLPSARPGTRVVRLAPSSSAGIVTGLYNTFGTAPGAAAGAVFAAAISVSGSTSASERENGMDYSAYAMVRTIVSFGSAITALAWTIRDPANESSRPRGGAEGGRSDVTT